MHPVFCVRQLCASALAFALVTRAAPTPFVSLSGPPCVALQPGGPLEITADCVDPLYSVPIIDSETDADSPSPYRRRVGGHWNGTGISFSIYLPPKSQWKGRFFQVTYPIQETDPYEWEIEFALASGGMAVQAKGRAGYRHDAATAKFAKVVAREYYGEPSRSIYGYLYGGSGGSFTSIGGIENSRGVWDGAVVLVQAIPISNPSSGAVKALASLVLEPKYAHIADAVRPGGSGDPFLGLSSLESEILREASLMGLPIRGWEDAPYIARPDLLEVMTPSVKAMDPSYAQDFWSKPGYLGTEKSELGDIIRAATTDVRAIVKSVERTSQGNPSRLVLETPSGGALANRTAGLDYTLCGGITNVTEPVPLVGALDPSREAFSIGDGNSAEVLERLEEGIELCIDNKWYMAMHAHHRHQIPADEGLQGFGFDQFKDANGFPLYPQRSIDVSRTVASSTSGGAAFNGNFTTKTIVIENLLDTEAFPFHADWYRGVVKQTLGAGFEDNYRIWYHDHADHIMGPIVKEKERWLIDFTGIYEQALRDVSAWAENGIAPAQSTGHEIVNGQVLLAESASDRRGIQPVVTLTGQDGRGLVEISAGERVHLEAIIDVPPGAGSIVAVEWDWHGRGNFRDAEFEPSQQHLEVQGSFRYCKPGTYYPNIKVTAQREGDAETPFGRVRTLGRARVVVN